MCCVHVVIGCLWVCQVFVRECCLQGCHVFVRMLYVLWMRRVYCLWVYNGYNCVTDVKLDNKDAFSNLKVYFS